MALTVPLAGGTGVAGEPAHAAAAGAAKQERTISVKGVEPRDDVFFAKGRVRPAYRERRAIMQRKPRSADGWRDWRTFRTTDESRFRERIAPLRRKGVVCYRVKIEGNRKFSTSFSPRVCIRTS